MRRQRLYCTDCRKIHLRDCDELGIGRSAVTKGLAKAATSLAIFSPAEHAVKMLKDLINISISDFNLKRIVGNIGANLKIQAEAPFTIEDFEKVEAQPNPEVAYIQADGGMVPIKGEKSREYKENKLGLVFTGEDIQTIKTRDGKIRSKITGKKFAASLGEGVDHFKDVLVKAAMFKKATFAKTLVFLSDGAEWLRNLQQKKFPQAIRILDWYHAIEHLWSAARALFGDDEAKIKKWVRRYETLLWHGKVKKVLSELSKEAYSYKGDATPFWELYNYYYKNAEAMDYSRFRQQGLFIGSGAVESAHKYIVSSRLKQAGMRWTKRNAIGIIWLRCLFFEGTWDSFWAKISPAFVDAPT